MSIYIASPIDVFRKMRDLINTLWGAFLFSIENYRKRYPYILLGEQPHHDGKETILLYRIAGKRHVFEMPAKEVCNSKKMISKFHPLDVRVISFIAGVEQILELPPESRREKFESLKKKIFKA